MKIGVLVFTDKIKERLIKAVQILKEALKTYRAL